MYGYDSFVNYDEEDISKGDPNEEVYQGPPDYPEVDEIMYNIDEERAANSYDQYIGAEVVISDWKCEKLMGEVSKCVKYYYSNICEGNYNATHDKSLYEVYYPYGTMEQLTANILAENMISKVDSEGRHCQVFTEVTDNKKYDSAIVKVDGFINSSSGNLHRKRTTLVWKLLV